MLSRVTDPAIRVIYATILLLGVAYGLAISLIANYLRDRGFKKEEIGTLAIWFAGGIVAFAIPAGALIRKFNAKTVLLVSLAGYASTVTLFPFMPGYLSIGVLRLLDGAFSVGVWVSSETILLSRAPAKDKAYATSLYAISLALGYVIGPILARGIAPNFGVKAAFITAGALSAINAVMVLVRLDKTAANQSSDHASADASSSDSGTSLSTTTIANRIKTSCFATFAYGYFQASVVLFLPLYMQQAKGLSEADTILMPAFFAGGMLLFANPAAQVGDRFGHLRVMTALAALGTIVIISFLYVHHAFLVFGLVFLAGASLASVSPVSLALQGTVVPAKDLSRAGGMYNAFYAVGMLVGPVVTSQIYAKVTGEAMIQHFAALWACFVFFALVFRRDDPHGSRLMPSTRL